jgi:ABC-type multidrug transport system fused ATPase/permease subunit
LADKIADAQIALFKFVEERVKVTSEALQGIRVMKFYAWEDSIAQRVEKLRFEEIKLYRRFHFLQIINGTLLFMTPVFLGALVLGIYIVIKTTLSVTDAFILIALVNISRLAVSMFPIAVAGTSQARIALHRVDKYLASVELLDHLALSNSLELQKGSISVRGGTFSWSHGDSDSSPPQQTSEGTQSTPPPMATAVTFSSSKALAGRFQLHDINLDIKPGSLVMIVGKVGSGKTSFLNALLNEMILEAGEISVNGEIAYVSQQAWIRNSTVKENILFESPFDAKRYMTVLHSTQLNLDLQALPNGDQTEIGEQGINLSGGQKARVSIARAMYRFNYEILILDDPLSAVDPHVAHAIFEQCIQGLAKEKTRLLVLNSHYDLLPHADKVLVVGNGTIVGNGTYAEVLENFPELRQEKKVQEAEEQDIIDEHVEEGENEQGEERKSLSLPQKNAPQEEDKKQGEVPKQTNKNNNIKGGGLIQEEDRVKGKVSGSTYRNYFDETGYNGVLVVSVVSALYGVSQGLRIFVDWWQGYWAKQMSQLEYDALKYGMWYLGFILMCTILSLVRGFVLIEGCIRSSRNMHDELFRRVLSAPINRYFDVTPLGRILNRFSNDLDQVDAVLPQLWHALFVIGAVFLGSLLVCAITSYWIALSYLPMLGFFVVTGLYFKKTSREVKRLDGVSRTPIFNLFSETLNGLSTIRAFQMQPKFIELNKKSIDDNATFYLTYWAAGRWLAIRLDWMSVAIILVVSLYLVIAKGSISPILAGLSIVYSLSLTSMIQWVVRSLDMTDNGMTSVERLLHFRNIPVEGDGINAEDVDLATWPSKGALRFENLQLRYRPELPLVLHGVDMDVAGGEKVGICGRTGAGKSSLMIALFRICEFDAGIVYIDGINISKVKLVDLRRSLAIIPQDPVLYSGTLRENLDPFHEYEDEHIWSVLRQIHLADTITKWGSGLEFQVSEKGGNLSVGQRQLLCIGRALLKDSKVVVLDEATANVDTATDNLIQETIKKSLCEKTVLIIAHRINTIMHCDKIAVMDAGRVAEFGSPMDLLSQPESIFASFAKRSGHT